MRWGLATVLVLTCLMSATTGSASSHRDGGTLRVNVSLTQISTLDPAIDYEYYGGQLLYATCLRLLNYSDRRGHVGQLVPEAASRWPTVSEDGLTYTFTVRSGYRFNTGEPVTAASFSRALERVLAKKSASPGAQFYTDIVGAADTLAGTARHPRGIVVSGNTIAFHLTARSPTFPARLAMNFGCAQPVALPLSTHGVDLPPMAGPYYIAAFDQGREIVLQKNPNYHGPRAAHADRIVVTTGTSLDTSLLQVRAGQADYDLGGLPPTSIETLVKKYGVNRGRFFVHNGLLLEYLALNTAHGPLRDVRLRKAVNYAIDRLAIARLNGPYGGKPTDQVLVPGVPGYHNASLYPNHPDVARARALVAGRHVSLILYSGVGQPFENQDQLIQRDLAAAGIQVQVRAVPFDQLLKLIGNTNTRYDMVDIGWGPDFIDPYDYIDLLLNGSRITTQNNVQWAQFDHPAFNKRMDTDALLSGARRRAEYAKLDADLMRQAAPLAPMYVSTVREFVSSRVGCYTFVPALQAMSLAAACVR